MEGMEGWTGQGVSPTSIWKNCKDPSTTTIYFFTTTLDFQSGLSNLPQYSSVSLGLSFPEKNVMQPNSLKGGRELMCYLTLGAVPSNKEPGEDNGRPQLNELSATDLKHGCEKY